MTFNKLYFRCDYSGGGVKWSHITVAEEMSHGESTPTQ